MNTSSRAAGSEGASAGSKVSGEMVVWAARTLSAFRRRITAADRTAEVELHAGEARWLGAQEHTGENIGDSASHSVFIELKEPRPTSAPLVEAPLGPSAP